MVSKTAQRRRNIEVRGNRTGRKLIAHSLSLDMYDSGLNGANQAPLVRTLLIKIEDGSTTHTTRADGVRRKVQKALDMRWAEREAIRQREWRDMEDASPFASSLISCSLPRFYSRLR